MSFEPSRTRSDGETVGVYRIDAWRVDSLETSLSLKDGRTVLGSLPINTFDLDTYPNAELSIIDKAIPVAFGKVKGLMAYPIDTTAKKFKVVDHSVITFDRFQDEDGVEFTPDSADIANGEFIYTAWDGDQDLFVDLTAEGQNPVDCVKLLLTDSVKGAGLPLTDLDTTSTGNKGFGSNGARLEYVMATDSITAAETVEFPIGLYVDRNRTIFRWIEKVLAASFAILYVNLSGKYQIRSWKVETSEGIDKVTDNNIKGKITTRITAADTITKVIARYDERYNTGDFQTFEFSDDRVRQLRGFTQHKSLTQELPISSRFGAKYWAERSVGMRGVPRRILEIDVTQEFMLKEPGDYIRVDSDRDGIFEVFEILEVMINPGSYKVRLKLIDNRGHQEQEGFWVADTITFPGSLGGGTFSAWDANWTDAQKLWAKENSGFWGSDEDYIDETNDTVGSYRSSVWV
jgi:hypothetical protein